MYNFRDDFPIFNQKNSNQNLIYFDNAATSQKPQSVITSISDFYSKYNANIHRGIYHYSEYATILFENVRQKIATFLNANNNEIIFTTGTTGSINFVALAWADRHLKEGDEIVLTQMEHHSNLIPWQVLAKRKNLTLRFIPVNQNGELDLDVYKKLLNKKTKLVSVVHVSNVLGTENDINLITKMAKEFNATVLIDAAQSVGHQKIDVKNINCDFLAFSSHKMLGPTGIGILYINRLLHEQIDPYQFGGGMVFEVDFNNSHWAKSPHKFEAGTPPIAQAIGLGAAIDYINEKIDFNVLKKFESSFIEKIVDELSFSPKISFLGPVNKLKQEGHILSFTVAGLHPHDIAAYLDDHGICVRAGHHCAQPLHEIMNIQSSVRVSFYVYNTIDEVNYFIKLMRQLLENA